MNALSITFVLAGLVAVSVATTCYSCTSCEDDYAGSSSDEIDCTGLGYTEDGGCSKTKGLATVLGAKVQTVVRTCGQIYDNSLCEQGDRLKVGSGSAKAETWSCSCEGEKCNGSAQMTVSTSLILAAVAKYLF